MRDETESRSFVFCIAGAGFCGAVMLFISAVAWPQTNAIRLGLYAVLFSVIIFFGLLLLTSIPAVVTHWLEHRAYWRTLHPSPPEPRPRIVDQVQLDAHADAWRAYWLAALDYASQVGGVSYQRTRDFFGSDHATWRECFILPLVRAGYVNPVQAGIETTAIRGWTIGRIQAEVERDALTPLPYPPPTHFGKQATEPTAQNSGKTESKTVFAIDR